MRHHKSITPERLTSLLDGIKGWQEFIDTEKRGRKNLIDAAERTIESFHIELKTGVAVCSCCHKPFGEGMRI